MCFQVNDLPGKAYLHHLYTVIIAPLQQITLRCYEYEEPQRGTVGGGGQHCQKEIPHTVGDEVLAGLIFPRLMDTMQGWTSIYNFPQ